MDVVQLDLVRQLCTQAGMIMEDMSAKAVMLGGLDAEALGAVVREGRQEMDRASALLAGAAALIG